MKNYFSLTRSTLSAVIALSAVVGFIAFSHNLNGILIAVFAGVFFLSGAASALNQLQERKWDAQMERTQNRPLPSGRIQPDFVRVVIILNGIAGLLLLLMAGGFIAAALGCFNFFWYNGVYTPLKRKTRFALITGALTGAIPPVIGWVSAGGYWLSPVILLIGFYLFMWQMPHFLFLYQKYSSDYRKAGFPQLFDTDNKKSFSIILFIWILGTAVSSLFLGLFGVVEGFLRLMILCGGNALFLIYYFYILFLRTEKTVNKWGAFYAHQAFVFILLIVQAFSR